MGLKDLCERLGAHYSVSTNDKDEIINVKIYSNTEKLWAYRKPIDVATLSGLFKEVYGDIVKDLLPTGVNLLDKIEKE